MNSKKHRITNINTKIKEDKLYKKKYKSTKDIATTTTSITITITIIITTTIPIIINIIIIIIIISHNKTSKPDPSPQKKVLPPTLSISKWTETHLSGIDGN